MFGDSDSFSDQKIKDTIRIIIQEQVIVGNDSVHGRQENGRIYISKQLHSATDDLDHSNTRQNTDIFKPGNLRYLNTFIHEATHWWQRDNNRYTTRQTPPEYEFDYDQLRDLDFDCKEGHASAAGTWFIIGWQLEYGDSSEKVNLTTSPPRFTPEVVGTVASV